MHRKKLFWAALVVGLVWLAGPQPVSSQEIGEAVAVEPRRIEVVRAPAPTRMLAQEGLAYLELLRKQRESELSRVAPEDGADETGADTGVSRIYEVERQPVVNPTHEFRFSDATARTPAARPLLTLAQRRSAVDAFRREAARKGRTEKDSRE